MTLSQHICTSWVRLILVWKQEEKWRDLIAKEIDTLQKTIMRKDEKISDQTVQLEEIKKSFLYNYELLKSRDDELVKFEETVDRLKGVSDQLISPDCKAN